MSPCRAPALKPCLTSDLCRIAHLDLAIAEDDGVADVLAADQLAQHLALGPVLAVGAEAEVLGDGLGRGGRRGDLDALGILEELADEARDLGRHRRREEQRLPARRQQLADLLDVGDEAHVEHAVGLVDDEDLDAHQHDASALEMVEQASGRSDQHVDAAVELLDLIVHRHAADQQRQVQLVVDAVLLEALRHLRGELARRREDQRARHARPGAARLEPGDHRQHERCGLAGARLGDAEDIAAGHGDRDGGGLNGRRRRVAGSIYGRLHLGAQSELREGLSFRSLCLHLHVPSPQALVAIKGARSSRAGGERGGI